MTRRTSLLGHFADLVIGTAEPQRLGERTLEVVMALVNGRSSGVFEVADQRLTLFTSRGIDQHVLDAVDTLWRRAKDQLRCGRPIYVPDTGTDLELARTTAGGPASLAMFPVLDDHELVGVLYVDSAEPHFCQASDVERLAQFSRMLACTVRPQPAPSGPPEPVGWEAYLERTPVQDIERQKLLLLLNKNEWNIARVARLMGVARRTVYLRLQRYNIPRERVAKTRLRSAAAS
jgi:transcriptional regulator with GAF, ATPase, and Fis domain